MKNFHHSSQVLRDWHLLAVTVAVTGTSVFLLLLETAIPPLKGKVTQEVDQENPSGMTVSALSAMQHCINLPLIFLFCTAPWNQAAVLCINLLRSVLPKLLLENLHLCLPSCASNNWDHSLIPNKKGESPRPKGFQMHRHYYLHLKYCYCGAGSGDILPEDIHQHWNWDIRSRNIHPHYNLLGTYLHP